MIHWDFAVNFFVALFALLDPVGNVPVFAASTVGASSRERAQIALVISLFVMGFLTAMLRRGGGRDRSDFADQFAFHPQRTGLIDKILHLCRHVAEAGRRTEDDSVILGELVNLGNRGHLIELIV